MEKTTEAMQGQAEAGSAVAATTPAAGGTPFRGIGVGKRCRELIKAGKSNKEVLQAIQAELPQAHTTMASINWYRNDMRKKGDLPKVDHAQLQGEREKAKEVAKAAKAAKKEAEAAAKAAQKKVEPVAAQAQQAKPDNDLGDALA